MNTLFFLLFFCVSFRRQVPVFKSTLQACNYAIQVYQRMTFAAAKENEEQHDDLMAVDDDAE